MKASLTPSDKKIIPIIIGLSIVVPIVVIILMNLPTRYNLLGLDVGTFPFFHAVINGLTAALLFSGYTFIKQKKKAAHRAVMITAFGLSALFLVSYVISKISNDPVPYGGDGVFKYIYFFILITHIALSAIIIPTVLRAKFYFVRVIFCF